MIRCDDWETARSLVENGEQVLHVWEPTDAQRRAVRPPFRYTNPWGYLFDLDYARLVATAKDLGVLPMTLRVEGRGTIMQHVDLCGDPLRRAILRAEARS